VLRRLIDFLRERRDRVGEWDLGPDAAGVPVGAAAHYGN
jgi:hypothetical protein